MTDGVFSAVHTLFEAEARRAPNTTAVRMDGAWLTYAELDAAGNGVAGALRARGVGRGARVGVLLPRSGDLAVALLGILKAGACYVPLDPDFPAARLSFMAADAQLTACMVAGPAPGLDLDVPIVDVRQCAKLPSPPASAPSFRADADDLAYLIYTSGSTGHPKGVTVRHGSVAALVLAMGKQLDVRPGDVWLSVTTPSFDIFAAELFVPLSIGATVELVGSEVVRDPTRLADAIAGSGATLMQATPTTWGALVEAGWEGARALRAVTGGEAIPGPLVERLASRVAQLWNYYGPTETTIWSTSDRLAVTPGGGPVTIGTPLPGTVTQVVDGALCPVAAGTIGELCIGGLGVARGYWRRPGLTAERFVPDPEGPAGSRRYRTGDLVRSLPDGRLVCLGRVDTQIKIHGHRVELGEIEDTLRRLPGITAAAVTVQRTPPLAGRLVAYVTSRQGNAELDEVALLAKLGEQLPDYMVPRAIVTLATLPTTLNGKIDRAALPPHSPTTRRGRGPSSDAEAEIVRLVEEVLGVTEVGIDDRFVALGGDSVAAMRLAALAVVRGIRLSALDVLHADTIAELAARLGRGPISVPPEDPTTEPVEQRLTPMQSAMLLHELVSGSSMDYVEQVAVPVYEVAEARVRHALEQVVARHATLRAAIDWRDRPEPVQRTHRTPRLPWQCREHSGGLDADGLQAILDEERAVPFTLTEAPLFRVLWVQHQDGAHLVLTYHHLVLDGWSVAVVLEEVSRLCRDVTSLAPAATTFAARVDEIHVRDFSPRATAWLHRLSIPASRICVGPLRFADGDAGYDQVHAGLSAARSEVVRGAAVAAGMTLGAFIHAAVALWLAQETRCDAVRLGTLLGGRMTSSLPGADRLIGMLINILPLAIEVPREAELGDWLRAFARELDQIQRDEELGQDQLRAWAGVTIGEPLFEVLYVFDPGARAARRAAASAIFGEEIESTPRSGYAVHLGVRPESKIRLELTFDRSRVDITKARVWLWRLERTLSILAAGGAGSVATVIGSVLDPLPSVGTLGPDVVDGLDNDELDRLYDLLQDERE